MKKEYLFVIILSLLVLSLGGYIVYENYANTKKVGDSCDCTNNEEKNDDSKNLTGESIYDYFVYEESFDYNLNNKNHKITYKYYYNKEIDDGYTSYYLSVKAFLNNNLMKYQMETKYFLSVLLDNTEFDKLTNNSLTNSELTEVIGGIISNHKHKDLPDENSLLKLKGGDKEYLVLAIYPYISPGASNINPQIVSDTGQVLYIAETNGGTSFVYVDEKKNEPYMSTNGYYNQYYIDYDKLYYIADPGCKLGVGEFVVTIDNDIITTKKTLIPEDDYTGAGEKC